MVDGGLVFPMSFLGPYSPLTGPILEGPRGQNSYFKPRILTRPRFGARGATQPPDPTLPSRAHHKDYVSRTTSSNHWWYFLGCGISLAGKWLCLTCGGLLLSPSTLVISSDPLVGCPVGTILFFFRSASHIEGKNPLMVSPS